jgi:hypothetical protein
MKQSFYERELPGQALTLDQFTEIVKEVAQNHMFYFWQSPLQEKGKHIKYIYQSSFDVRDGTITIFHIAFRGMSGLKKFDYRDSSEPMYDRIMKWLKDLDQK